MKTGSHKGMDVFLLKQVNYRAILDVLRTHGPSSRKEIAEQVNLSIPAVWRLVNELVEARIVAEVGSGRGSKPGLVDINPNGGWIIAMDLGGGHVKAGAMDLSGKLHSTYQEALESVHDEEFVRSAVISLLERILEEHEPSRGKPLAAGISSTGTIDSELGIIRLSFNLQLENFQIARIVREVIDVPVILDNNITCATLAESKLGHGKTTPTFSYVSVGIGIGAGYAYDGVVQRYPSTRETGLIVVAPDADPEGFGSRGYLESVSSGRAIASAARREIQAGTKTLISELAPAGLSSVTAKTVSEAAQMGDEAAKNIMAKAAHYLGIAVVNFAYTLGIRLFVVNGGVSKAGEVFWAPLRQSVSKYEYWPGEIRLEESLLQEDAALLGAGLFALEAVFRFTV